jgi:hypothetical protein
MTDTLLKRFIFVENPNGMIGKQLIPISSPQIQILLVQGPFGTYNHQQQQQAISRQAASKQQPVYAP